MCKRKLRPIESGRCDPLFLVWKFQCTDEEAVTYDSAWARQEPGAMLGKNAPSELEGATECTMLLPPQRSH